MSEMKLSTFSVNQWRWWSNWVREFGMSLFFFTQCCCFALRCFRIASLSLFRYCVQLCPISILFLPLPLSWALFCALLLVVKFASGCSDCPVLSWINLLPLPLLPCSWSVVGLISPISGLLSFEAASFSCSAWVLLIPSPVACFVSISRFCLVYCVELKPCSILDQFWNNVS